MNIQDLFCGVVAGWSQIIVGQPFDFVKVKIQTEKQKSQRKLIEIAQQIRQVHGLQGFYRGASSLFFGFAFTIGLQFAVYEAAKRFIYNFRTKNQENSRKFSDQQLSIPEIGIAGAIVGLVVSNIYCPIEYVKIQKQLNGKIGQGSLSMLFHQIKNNGLRNITKGFCATALRQIVGSFIYFAVYELMLRTFTGQKRQTGGTFTYILSGGLAGVGYWLFNYPIDVVKTKVQNGQCYTSSIKELFPSSYRGFSVVFIRSLLVNGVSFATYENCKKLIQFTGSKKQIY